MVVTFVRYSHEFINNRHRYNQVVLYVQPLCFCYFSSDTDNKTDDEDSACDDGSVVCEFHLKNLTEIVNGYLDEELVYTIYCGRDDLDE